MAPSADQENINKARKLSIADWSDFIEGSLFISSTILCKDQVLFSVDRGGEIQDGPSGREAYYEADSAE